MVVASDFQTKILSRKTTPEEYQIYKAGLEWDLTDPIVIESSDDFKSAQRWHDRLTPYHHQVTNLITFCRRLPVTLLADDVGLSKTISAGLIISELISRSRLSKILIVCPKLLGPQWKEELATKFDIQAKVATGRALIKADPDDIGAVITTYNSARLYLEAIPEDRFQMLVLDEAHKLRNLYGVEKTPEVAKRFRKALEDHRFRFVLMLTATPIQNRLWDLYSLVDLLTVARGHQNPFGSEGMFARRIIADKRQEARRLKPDPFLFNVSNGTLVLGPMSKDCTVRIDLGLHNRADLITHMSPVAYDPEATAPVFLNFLERVLPNPEIRLFLQIWLGYSLTGDVSEQVMALFHGTGANGKSTLLKIIAATFGDYAITLPIQTFLADERRSGGDATPDLARLPGARLVMVSEPERGSRLSEAVVKTVTGGERVVARRLFEGQFEFDPSFKLTLSANEKPRITGQDEGIWRRVILVPFDVFIAKNERNRRLFEMLLTEMPGILNWLLDGYRLWRERGLVRRWQAYTAGVAKLAANGTSFESVLEDRHDDAN